MDDNQKQKSKWYEIGVAGGIEIKAGAHPRPVDFIEDRGFLCHELLYLLGGVIEYRKVPWRQILRRLWHSVFGGVPICRWYPPDGLLEKIGFAVYDITNVAYRFSAQGKDTVVFLVRDREYDQDLHYRPRLNEHYFLCPPFDHEQYISFVLRNGLQSPFSGTEVVSIIGKLSSVLRNGLQPRFCQSIVDEDILSQIMRRETKCGMWEVLSSR